MSTPLPPFPHCLSIFVSFSGRCMHAFVAPPSSIFLSPLVGLSAFAFAFAFALLPFLLFLRLRLRWPRFSYLALPCPASLCLIHSAKNQPDSTLRPHHHHHHLTSLHLHIIELYFSFFLSFFFFLVFSWF
ncbi:uncharacterized protein IWZ02DRAFT_442829 [Phyllosticta citriasiana]|uniref:uncharacterized protein n=1 Tax=Phyllosticta citriasiana TaxID=595635 RepID=UPI0030FD677C